MNNISDVKTSSELLNKTQGSTVSFVIYPFLLLLIAISIFLFFGKKETVIDTYAVLEVPNISNKISSPSSSPITNIYIENGNKVNKGDKILEFDSKLLSKEMSVVDKNISEKKERLKYIDFFLDSFAKGSNQLPDNKFGYQKKFQEYINKKESLNLENSIKHSETNSLTEQFNNLDRKINEKNELINEYMKLIEYIDDNTGSFTFTPVNSKLISEYIRLNDEIESSEKKEIVKSDNKVKFQNSIEITNNEILDFTEEKKKINNLKEINNKQAELNKLNVDNEINNTIFDYENEKSRIQTELETELQNLNKYRDLILNNTITAPVNGKLELSESIKIGSVVSEGTEVGEILKEGKNSKAKLTITIPSSEISNIYINQKIRFVLNSKNNNKDKTILGYIDNISKQPKQTENGNYYLAYAKITDKDEKILIHGSEGKTSIITGENTYMNILLKKFF